MATMGNSLLDFVMALVRDPDVAAKYAADPAGALADAQLAGVTIADVQNLIPVVTDSLALATPGFGAVVDTADVWTSGAAASAFDAFAVPHAGAGPDLAGAVPDFAGAVPDFAGAVSDVAHVDVPAVQVPSGPLAGEDPAVPAAPLDDLSVIAPEPLAVELSQVDQPAVDEQWAPDHGWHDPGDLSAQQHPVEHPGFDLF